jgi:rhomboid family GlyGly-CTERM serine protease
MPGVSGNSLSIGGRRIPCASLLLGLLALGLIFLPRGADLLEYDRLSIAQGGIWRLFTCHWTHFSFDHLLWDLLAFLALGAACERQDRKAFFWCLLVSAGAISMAVWIFQPGLAVYRGLSGIDSALFAYLAVRVLGKNPVRRNPVRVSAISLVLLLFAGKVIFEMVTGSTLFVTDLGNGVVPIPMAHLAGAAAGAGSALAALRASRWPIRSPAALPNLRGRSSSCR